MNRLPPEIISSVVQYVQDGEIWGRTRRIIPLTHVCRYWRTVVISAPNFWTSISTDDRKNLAELSLGRTEAAPLDIHIDMDRFQENNWTANLLRPKVQYTKSLAVLNPPWRVEDVATALPDFPQSMPNLRSLKIIKGPIPDWDRTADPFGSFSHSLRCLTLKNIPLYPSFLNLGTLTTLSLNDDNFHLHLDTLLDFLEANHSLQSATLCVSFMEPSLRSSQRQSPIGNQLQHLSISCMYVTEVQALVSNIALQRGAHLEIWSARLNQILSGISTTHLTNLPSPTSVEYEIQPRRIRLSGPNGSFSLDSFRGSTSDLFVEFPFLPLANVREFHLIDHESSWTPRLSPATDHLSSLPSLKTFTFECETGIPYLSTLLLNSSSPPSLTTLAFLNCDLSDLSVEVLTRFASNRKNTTSTRLHRVVIVDSGGKFPSAASIDALEKHVPAVDVVRGEKLPTDLWCVTVFPSSKQ